MFVLPGFVTLAVDQATYTLRPSQSQLEELLRALVYSVVDLGLLLLIAALSGIELERARELALARDGLWPALGIGALGLLAVAAAVSTAVRVLRQTGSLRRAAYRILRINANHRVPTAWDHFFIQEKSVLLRVVLQDGRVLGGLYGRYSFAARSQEGEDLFLEQRWKMIDDWFDGPVVPTSGLWIRAGEIRTMDFVPYHQP